MTVCEAVRHGDHVALVTLLRAGGSPDLDDEGLTPLMIAAARDDVAAAALLLSHGADVAVAGADGITPLMCATEHRSGPMVTLLLEFGADPNVRDSNGRTALDHLPRTWSLALGGTNRPVFNVPRHALSLPWPLRSVTSRRLERILKDAAR